jgi:hypothetical protein
VSFVLHMCKNSHWTSDRCNLFLQTIGSRSDDQLFQDGRLAVDRFNTRRVSMVTAEVPNCEEFGRHAAGTCC